MKSQLYVIDNCCMCWLSTYLFQKFLPSENYYKEGWRSCRAFMHGLVITGYPLTEITKRGHLYNITPLIPVETEGNPGETSRYLDIKLAYTGRLKLWIERHLRFLDIQSLDPYPHIQTNCDCLGHHWAERKQTSLPHIGLHTARKHLVSFLHIRLHNKNWCLKQACWAINVIGFSWYK